MKKICISKEWQFVCGNRQSITVDLPHDYAVSLPRTPDAPGGAQNGYFNADNGTYTKYITLPDAHCILDVDGAYMNAHVSLNGDLLAIHPHGYTPLLVDLTAKMYPNALNQLRIETRPIQPSTRWYSGAGLYRDVFLWTGGAVRVEPWDVFAATVRADEASAEIRIAYQIAADRDADAQVKTTIVAPDGQIAAESVDAVCAAAGKTPLTVSLTVPHPQRWDLDTPTLYTIRTEITVGGDVTDTAETTLGIRTIAFDAAHGFRLNGRTVKMRGGCIHHDHGVLGAAAFPAAEQRKLSRLKAAGFNAVRIAHNPPSLALLEAADRIGMLVMDEAFDMWNCGKTADDYHLAFGDWWARDIAYMVQRDRSHPCVVSYSIGNEIIERDGQSDGAMWAAKLADEIRRYDTTRPVTSGICDLWKHGDPDMPDAYRAVRDARRAEMLRKAAAEGKDEFAYCTEPYMNALDIVGYNYLYFRYASDHKIFPNRVIWGSETQALLFYDSWHAVLDNDHAIGDFTWTAYDNLGEAGAGRSCWKREGYIPNISLAAYPWRTCFQGDLDLCGYRRPQSYFREAVWIGHTAPRIFTTHPMHYGEEFSGTHWHWYDVLDTWTYPAEYIGKPVPAEVYTDADEIEWALNGRVLGCTKPEKAIARMDIPYEPGTLTATAIYGGQRGASFALHTVGAPAAIDVAAERASFAADRRDLCYFDITITDDAGDRVPNASTPLECFVDGGELMGIFSGDPKNEDVYTSNRAHAFEGRAVAVVRTDRPGTVKVVVRGGGLRGGAGEAVAE